MATVVGGLRARYIRQSLFDMVEDCLTQLNWFDTGRPHLPIRFDARTQNQDEQILMNTAALSDEGMLETDWELGSMLTEHNWQMFIDFFAESDALGLHFARDVQDILRGRFSTLGRTDSTFPVYDYMAATPPILFYCDIENVQVIKAQNFVKPWLEHWYEISFEVIDYYDSEDG